ncbi:MAG: carbohydrate-binding domain-containing protein [Oscillospiraceae bacterium]|nr:carbohydrate-binding domain-containing protein [Oscillospiraceae bacterium]
MKKKQLIWAAALLLTFSLTSCGQESAIVDDPGNAEESIVDTLEDDAEDEASEEETDEETASSEDTEDSAASTGKTEKNSAKTTSTTAKNEKNEKGSAATTQKNNTGSNANSTGKNDSANTQKPQQNGTAAETPVDEDDDPEEEAEQIKYIYLQGNTAQYSGDGIEVHGNVVKIGKGGVYEISGTLSNGQILIQTDSKKVRLHLNGASITNHAGSAINCQKAKRLTIKSMEGSVNYLEDGGVHDDDKGTIFTEDTVVFKGTGELNIVANYAHGVQSDDDIVVNSGTLNITSAKSCLHSNDGIEINGGSIMCNGGTNGIKTDGYVTITGGNSVFLGGVREEKGAIYCSGTFTVTGGSFYALGNTCTTPDASTTTANVIGLMFPNPQKGDTIVNIISGGNTILNATSPRQFKYVVYCGPDLLINAEYQVNYGGTIADGSWVNYVNYGGTYTGEKDGGSFVAGNTVTFYTVP